MLLPAPNVNIVCYLVHHPSLSTLAGVNAFNERVYARMSLGVPGASPSYIITRTRLQAPMYQGAVEPLLEQLGVCDTGEWEASGVEGLVVLRSTVMDPFLVAPPPAPDHIAGFVSALRSAALQSLDKAVSGAERKPAWDQ